MKNAKKILERKRKIIVVLVVMVSFVSVLAWYQMKKAHAYQSYNTGGNKHFKDGHLTVNINGPNGKSDSLTMYIHSDEYEKNKNVSGGTFNNSRHPYTVTTYSGGGGDYKLTVKIINYTLILLYSLVPLFISIIYNIIVINNSINI